MTPKHVATIAIPKAAFNSILTELRKALVEERYTTEVDGLKGICFSEDVVLVSLNDGGKTNLPTLSSSYNGSERNPYLEIFKLVTGGHTFEDYNRDGTLKDEQRD
jgi:hypothetical protein